MNLVIEHLLEWVSLAKAQLCKALHQVQAHCTCTSGSVNSTYNNIIMHILTEE